MIHCGLCGAYMNDAFHGEWSICDECGPGPEIEDELDQALADLEDVALTASPIGAKEES